MRVPEPILRIVNLNKAFFMGETIYAVSDVNVDIFPGEFVVIMGPSGSGKSTLLSLMGGLDRPISGDVILDGQRFSKLNENGLAILRRKSVGFVFQFFNLVMHLTALENVMLPLRFTGRNPGVVRERARELLAMVGLEARADHLPTQLSGGEQQRVAIARALANEPSVILADEPTGNLDSKTSSQVAELFCRFNQELGQTFVVVSHDKSLADYAHRTLYMYDGQLRESQGAAS